MIRNTAPFFLIENVLYDMDFSEIFNIPCYLIVTLILLLYFQNILQILKLK